MNVVKEMELFNKSHFLKSRHLFLKFEEESTALEPIIGIYEKFQLGRSRNDIYRGSVFGWLVEQTDVCRWNYSIYTQTDPGCRDYPEEWDDIENDSSETFGCWYSALEAFLINQFRAEYNDACEAMNSELYNI